MYITIRVAWLLIASVAGKTTKKWLGVGTAPICKGRSDTLQDCPEPPWGNCTAATCHPQYDIPDTGVTRYYNWTVARQYFAPDGVQQFGELINGQFPGPTVEANWGDWIEIELHNEIYNEWDGLTIHWHGIKQKGTPFSDGVPTVGQCPISPGTSLTYKFRADEFGTGWYHSHYSAQYAAGVVGPMVIYGPTHVDYDVDLGPIMVADFYHGNYTDLLANVILAPYGPGTPDVTPRPKADSNLVGGVGRYPCANVTDGTPCQIVPYASWDMEVGKSYRMRFISSGIQAFQQITIDNHIFQVIGVDYVPIEPYETDTLFIGIGQRMDVVVTATGDAGESYWLRAWDNPTCGDIGDPWGYGIIRYEGADQSEPTSTGPPPAQNTDCQGDPLSITVPIYALPVEEPDLTLTLVINAMKNNSDVWVYGFDNQTYFGDYDTPILYDTISQNQTTWPPERNVYNTGSAKTVRIILYDYFVAPHPIHLHGHDFQVLAEGFGEWDGTIVNPQNPARRDTQALWAGSNITEGIQNYAVFQFEQNNPGVWPFHCHLVWHLSAGMTFLILERPDEVMQMEIPEGIVQGCQAWDVWQTTHFTNVDDAGL